MLAVLFCIKDDHNLWLVALAALVCVTGVVTAFRFHRKAAVAGGLQRWVWSVLTGFTVGCAVWATHFVAVLAYQPDLPIRYNFVVTAASLLTGIAIMGTGYAVAARWRRPLTIALGGFIAGCGVVVLHFVGVAAMHSAFHIQWDFRYVAASMTVVAACGIAAMMASERARGWKAWVLPTLFMVVGIVGLHFTAMTAITIIPDLTAAPLGEVIDRGTLALLTGGVALLIIAAAAAMAFIETRTREMGVQSLRVAFQGVPSGMALYDPAGRLVLWNESYRRMVAPLGMVPEVGASREGLLAGARPEILGVAHEAASSAGKGYSSEWHTPEGAWLRIELQPLPDGGSITVMSDITELKNVADAMAEARDRAEAASRAKSDFLANMSHEIRTPLNGVLGMAQVMAAGELSTQQRDHLQVIQDSGGALLGILNDVLDLSKVQAGKLELDPAPFNARDLANASVAAFQGAAAAKGVGLVIDIEPTAPAGWMGDSLRIRQVLSNLIGNAIKFTPEGTVRLEVTGQDGGVTFRVRDTGIGMDEDQIPRLFEKFSQADTTTTRRYGGTGLGLAICQELVELMGGTISATSERGLGSCFSVFLPLEAAEVAETLEAPQAAPAPEPAEFGLRILAAEDNPTNQVVLRSLLAPLNAQLVIAANGAEAVEAFTRQTFDIVLMDIQMPEMNGVQATGRIRTMEAEEARARTPILALSANVMTHQIEEYMAVGMDGWVAKPIDLATLYAAIDRALDGETVEGEQVEEAGEAAA